MSMRATEYPRASAALACLGLTTQIAIAATDRVPIVKQILGVVAHIVALAEKFEKDRDSVYSLAQKAKMMTDTIEAAVPNANPDGKVLVSLEHLHTVLSSIQKWLEKHTAKPRLLKTLSYLFTVSKDIDRLNQDLNTALSLFHLSAQIEASARKRFREIPDCDIDKLDFITDAAPRPICSASRPRATSSSSSTSASSPAPVVVKYLSIESRAAGSAGSTSYICPHARTRGPAVSRSASSVANVALRPRKKKKETARTGARCTFGAPRPDPVLAELEDALMATKPAHARADKYAQHVRVLILR
ncbi:hypothetical protein AURDEDRAFT_171305 [Auricularia subglabra TFB-10046 SS5]|nr:hypothetical protein AURDEDRAFT_171305 [Auricularia subglabra TFB-10046 SS5]